jgi:hypothetical protein
VPRLAPRRPLPRIDPKVSAGKRGASRAQARARRLWLFGVVPVFARSSRLDPKVALESPRQVGRAPLLLVPKVIRACGLRLAAPWGSLLGPGGPGCQSRRSGSPNLEVRLAKPEGSVRQSRRSGSPVPWARVAKPEGSVRQSRRSGSLPSRSHGFVRAPARSEDHACFQTEPSASRGSLPRSEDLVRFQQEPPVSSHGLQDPKTSPSAVLRRRSRPSESQVRRPRLLGVKSCRPRPPAPSIRRPRAPSIRRPREGGPVDSLGRFEKRARRSDSRGKDPKVHPSRLRPRLWHKVEHVHPGALRGRAVGSAPSVARTLENGPSLALRSRLQRLGNAPRSPRLSSPR